MGAAAFWIALAAVIIASGWFRSRSEAQKHETLRRIIEKTGHVDEMQMRALFQPPAPHIPDHVWGRPPAPGSGYRTLRVLGSIVLFVAIGLATLFTVLMLAGGARRDAIIGCAVASLVALFGAGLFFSSRFLARPPPSGQSERP